MVVKQPRKLIITWVSCHPCDPANSSTNNLKNGLSRSPTAFGAISDRDSPFLANQLLNDLTLIDAVDDFSNGGVDKEVEDVLTAAPDIQDTLVAHVDQVMRNQ